jgi:hypothetical protein
MTKRKLIPFAEIEFNQEITITVSGVIRDYGYRIDIEYDDAAIRACLDDKIPRLVKRLLKNFNLSVKKLKKEYGSWRMIGFVNSMWREK